MLPSLMQNVHGYHALSYVSHSHNDCEKNEPLSMIEIEKTDKPRLIIIVNLFVALYSEVLPHCKKNSNMTLSVFPLNL